MEIKLLKRLRKRFIWRYKDDRWCVYDTVLEREMVGEKGSLIYKMMKEEGVGDRYRDREAVKTDRKIQKERKEYLQEWQKYNPNGRNNGKL